MLELKTIINDKLNDIENRYEQLLQVCENCGEPLQKNCLKKKTSVEYDLNIESLKELKIACIMDSFTLESYLPECRLQELTPEYWEQEIKEFAPHMIFVESAWEGKDGLWHDKIVKVSEEYLAMAGYCHRNHIPVVFWNKEDPVWTDKFMMAAGVADIVFTTDIDCIEKYKRELGNDHVYLLHFAAQPQIHNPIEKYERVDKFCFAGAYYHRYPERCAVFDAFSDVFIKKKGLEIYDRNYKKARREHKFPRKYNQYIVGRLEAKEIDKAYKGYQYGVNMNSVSQSQTMFARRVIEMLASNTITIGNYCRGVKNFFGDLTICTDNPKVMEEKFNSYCSEEITLQKYKLLGLRKVLKEHLYEDRLSYVVEKVFGKRFEQGIPEIDVISIVENQDEYDRIVKMFERQSYNKSRLLVVSDGPIKSINNAYQVISRTEAENRLGNYFAEKAYIAVFDSRDYYGKNYLLDFALNTRYIDADALGKDRYYSYDGQHFICADGVKYNRCKKLLKRRSVFRVEGQKETSILALLDTESVEGVRVYATDEFNYCENYTGEQCQVVEDLDLKDQGLDMQTLYQLAESIECAGVNTEKMGGFVSRSNILVLTNHYPEYSNLYRNMFVHKRVKKYKKNGVLCDVMQMNLYTKGMKYREFEGINILEGKSEELSCILETGQIDTVCVHFMDSMMWEVLKNYTNRLKIIIWCHGADIQPWHRRSFLYETDEEKKRAEKQTQEKYKLWKEIFEVSEKSNIQFVFVSKYFADIVMEDYHYNFSRNQCFIIHNCIDTDLFSYQEKDCEQRKKVVSIRPYASEIYANDVMAATIQELSGRPFFMDMEFLIVGDGVLFDKTVKPLRKYKNVTIKKGFLRQQEIADIYKEYGVVLIPSRGDTQGVSRDEAMASGLVPVTSEVAAIPEFVDEECGFLAPYEDYLQMADDIEWLYYHEEQYCEMSKRAAKRVRELSSETQTIQWELGLFDRL